MGTSDSASTIAVLGAGVIGLTTALRLRADGLPVTVYAQEQTPHTTSDVAAAFWFPFHVGGGARVRDWSRRTREVYLRAVSDGAPGVVLAPLVVLQRAMTPALDISGEVDCAGAVAPGELPPGFGQGARADIPRVEVPAYLPWLQAELGRHGGRIERRAVRTADELLHHHALVVNCSGLGARSAAPDPSLYPIRGQILRVTRPAGLDPTIFLHEEGDVLTYVVPRDTDCVLGGTAQKDDWNREPDSATAASIFERCRELCPALAEAQILAHRVGLRPGRGEVRLEVEDRPSGRAIIHNYGHGGAGFTLAWGCADDVAARVRASGCLR